MNGTLGRRAFTTTTAALAATAVLPARRTRAADAEFTFRIAALAPQGSSWDIAFRAWNNTLVKETAGRVKLSFLLGASEGGEREVLRKIKSGELEGAVVTTTGISDIARSLLVLQLPGLFPDYAALDRVRAALDGEFRDAMGKGGFTLMGWSDLGRARIFSNREVHLPTDLKGLRTWAWRDDVVFPEFLSLVGAKAQRLEMNEVLPALEKGTVEAFPASALAAVSLQWFHHAKFVTQQSDSVVVGATVLRKEKVDALPADLRAKLMETAGRAHGLLGRELRKSDDKAYAAVLAHGIKAIDISKNQPQWQKFADQVRKNLTGTIAPAELVARVEKLAKG